MSRLKVVKGNLFGFICFFSIFIPTICLAEETIEGKLEHVLAENSSGRIIFESYFIRPSDGDRIAIELSHADQKLAESPGFQNRSHKFSLSGTVTPGVQAAAILPDEDLPRSLPLITGAKTVAFVIFTMPSGTTTVTSADVTRTMQTGWFGAGTSTVSSIFLNNSYGAISVASYNSFGPLALSLALPSTCDTPFYNSLDSAMLNAISGASIDLSSYSYVVYVLPDQIGDRCHWSGTTWGPNRVAVANDVNPTLVSHEIGHQFGMSHSAYDANNDGNIVGADGDYEYGDPSCIMGGVGRHYNLAHIEKREWWLAAGGNLGIVTTAAGSNSFSLEPFTATPSATGFATQAIQVELGLTSKYYITFVKNVPPADTSFDIPITSNNQIFITRTYPFNTRTYLVKRLTGGQSFEDPAESTTIEFLSQSGTTANVRVTRGALDSDGDGTSNDSELDDDNDGVPDTEDCAPLSNTQWTNVGFTDSDLDGYGESLSALPLAVCFGATAPAGYVLTSAGLDNCPAVSNPSQSNADGDNYGDVCDSDYTGGGGSSSGGSGFPSISLTSGSSQRSKKKSYKIIGTATGGLSTANVRIAVKAPGARSFSAKRTTKKLSQFGSTFAWSYTLTTSKRGTYQTKLYGCNASTCSSSAKTVKVVRR